MTSQLFYNTLNKIVGLARGKKYDSRKMGIRSMGFSPTSKPNSKDPVNMSEKAEPTMTVIQQSQLLSI